MMIVGSVKSRPSRELQSDAALLPIGKILAIYYGSLVGDDAGSKIE